MRCVKPDILKHCFQHLSFITSFLQFFYKTFPDTDKIKKANLLSVFSMMKINYTKLTAYNDNVKKQRRFLKFCLGIMMYIIVIGSFSSLSFSENKKKNAENPYKAKSGTNQIPELFAIWTYPTPPPLDDLSPEEKLICSYSPCVPLHQKIDFYPDPFMLNLSHFLGLSSNFDEFIQHHVWYKFLHGDHFPHHVQSVTMISILKSKYNVCVRILGNAKHDLVCSKDVKLYQNYNPTDATAVPPFSIHYKELPEKYGILEYNSHVLQQGYANVEDEMASLASLQYLPYLTDLIDTQYGVPTFEGMYFMNGWHGKDAAFPPHSKAKVVMTSMHVDDNTKHLVKEHVEYFKIYNRDNGPVGSVDGLTDQVFRENDIESYFSSVLTMTLNFPEPKVRNQVIIVDWDEGAKYDNKIPQDILDRAHYVRTKLDKEELDSQSRFKYAYDVMRAIAQAKVVICFNAQTAYLAMANGASVILVGDLHSLDGRLHGSAHMFHRQKTGPDTIWNWPDMNIEDIGPNPGVHFMDRYRASFVQHLKDINILHYDSANLFGMLPLKRLGRNLPSESKYPTHDFFQLVVTTAPETITHNIMRTIEAIYFFHPNAKVVVHTNTIPSRDSKFDIFKETGYNFEIAPYDFEEIFKHANFLTPEIGPSFIQKLSELKKNQHWYTHEADLVKMFMLERYGGVAMDIDAHLIQALPKSFENLAAWKTSQTKMVGTSIMMFNPQNRFLQILLEDALNIVVSSYNRDLYHIFGQDLITEHYLTKQIGTPDFKVLSHVTFHPYDNELDCFKKSSDEYDPVDEARTFSVHMNGVEDDGSLVYLKPGSKCDDIQKRTCIFCASLAPYVKDKKKTIFTKPK